MYIYIPIEDKKGFGLQVNFLKALKQGITLMRQNLEDYNAFPE